MAGPGRHWANLWKPLIDAFGSVLGEVLLRAFQPNHDRIVRLGLQHHVTSGIGHDITIDAADDAVRHARARHHARRHARGSWSKALWTALGVLEDGGLSERPGGGEEGVEAAQAGIFDGLAMPAGFGA